MLNYITNSIAIQIALGIFFFICACLFLYSISPILKKIKKKNEQRNPQESHTKDSEQKILPQIVIKNENNNQSGGNNHQEFNFGKPPRRLTEELEKKLSKFDKKSKFHLHVKLDDDEAQNLAHEIKNFLVKNSFNYQGMTAHGMMGGNAEIIIQGDE